MRQDVIIMFEGDSDRLKPKSCVQDGGGQTPAQLAIVDAKTHQKVGDVSLVLPWWNSGSVYG